MITYYLPIKAVHIAAVMASGGLFLLRALAVQAGQGWAMAASLRYLSYSIDTILLTAALMLLTLLPAPVFANGWLTVKVALLVVYVVLGSVALKRGQNRRHKLYALIAAALVYATMLTIARRHHPLGWLQALIG